MNNTSDSILTRIAAEPAPVIGCPRVNRRRGLPTCLQFAWGLPDAGLPWQCRRSRRPKRHWMTLRRRGLVGVSGATSGIRVRLDTGGRGVFLGNLDIAGRDGRKHCRNLATVRTPWGAGVVLGCELCPSAGQWWATAGASASGWNRYIAELASVQRALKPLLVLGWLRQFVSVDQRVWGVQLTDAGRDAAAHPPQIEPGPFTFDADCYRTAWADAVSKYSSSPPDCDGAIPRFLPASQWATSSSVG